MRRSGQCFSLIGVILIFASLAVAATATDLVECSCAQGPRVPFGTPAACEPSPGQPDLLFASDGDVRAVTLAHTQSRIDPARETILVSNKRGQQGTTS
jgi:hypothetical protein